MKRQALSSYSFISEKQKLEMQWWRADSILNPDWIFIGHNAPWPPWTTSIFLIYINDLPECINYASCHLFTDDAKLLKSVVASNDCTQLQLDLLSLEQWCNTWRLNLNQRKCTHLWLSLSNQASLLQTVEYKICETTLESVMSQRDLGVIVTNT